MSKDVLLRKVRSIQQYLAIGSEILILIAFAMSGMDTSVSGVMADIPFLKWFWAAVFALGIDTSFVISWVRCRQCVSNDKAHQLWWNVPVALGMSFVVWQPVMIQLLQQALNISFNQALHQLGLSIVTLIIARSIVAVVLGGILALTNVESDQSAAQASAQIERENDQQSDQQSDQSTDQNVRTEVIIKPMNEIEENEPVKLIEQPKIEHQPRFHLVNSDLDQEKLAKVRKVLKKEPEISDRQLAQKAGMAPATAKRYRAQLSTSDMRNRA